MSGVGMVLLVLVGLSSDPSQWTSWQDFRAGARTPWLWVRTAAFLPTSTYIGSVGDTNRVATRAWVASCLTGAYDTLAYHVGDTVAYADTALYALDGAWPDTSLYADTALYLKGKADSAVKADTALGAGRLGSYAASAYPRLAAANVFTLKQTLPICSIPSPSAGGAVLRIVDSAGALMGQITQRSVRFGKGTASYENYTAVVGGSGCGAYGNYAATVGGLDNSAGANQATIVGGAYHSASGGGSTIVGGTSTTTSGTYSVAAGASSSTISGGYSVGVGGSSNRCAGDYSFVGGVLDTAGTAAGNEYVAVVSGLQNAVAGCTKSIIGGGQLNRITANYGFIGAGYGNRVTGVYGAVPTGLSDTASGIASFATGIGCSATDSCARAGGMNARALKWQDVYTNPAGTAMRIENVDSAGTQKGVTGIYSTSVAIGKASVTSGTALDVAGAGKLGSLILGDTWLVRGGGAAFSASTSFSVYNDSVTGVDTIQLSALNRQGAFVAVYNRGAGAADTVFVKNGTTLQATLTAGQSWKGLYTGPAGSLSWRVW